MTERTVQLVTRVRYHLRKDGAEGETILCEEIVPLAYTGPAEAPQWLSPEESELLLAAQPERNLLPTAIDQQLGLLLPALATLQAPLENLADERAATQLQAHQRVRKTTHAKGRISVATGAPGGHPRRLRPVAEADLSVARRDQDFQTIRSEGGLLPLDLLRRVLDPQSQLPGTAPDDYGLPAGERLNEVITQSWNRLRRHWVEFQ